MVAANDRGSTIDLPRRNEQAEEQMAFGHHARRRERSALFREGLPAAASTARGNADAFPPVSRDTGNRIFVRRIARLR